MPIQTTDEETIRVVRATLEWHRIGVQRYGVAWEPTDADIRKSSLLARLLAGKPALPFAPPTAYSYPLYEVVEQPGPWFPFDVHFRVERDLEEPRGVFIEQGHWYARRPDPAKDEWLISWFEEGERLAKGAPLYRLVYVAEGLADGDIVPGSAAVHPPGGLRFMHRPGQPDGTEMVKHYAYRLDKIPDGSRFAPAIEEPKEEPEPVDAAT